MGARLGRDADDLQPVSTRDAPAELAPLGINANCVVPGFVATDSARLWADTHEPGGYAAAAAEWVKRTPHGRVGEADDDLERTDAALLGAAFVGLRALRWHGRTPSEPHHQVLAVFNVVAVGAALYLLAAVVDALVPGQGPRRPGEVLVVPYLGTAAAQLALLVYTLWRPWDAPLENLDPGCLPALLAAAVVSPLAFMVPGGAVPALLWIVLAPLIALAVYRRVRAGASWPRAVPWNTRLQAAAVVVALLLVAPLHLGLFAH